mgnify:FL=1
MSEQIKQAILALTSRQAVHFIEWYFESRSEPFTNAGVLRITEDDLYTSWISIKTVIEIQRLQETIKQNK